MYKPLPAIDEPLDELEALLRSEQDAQIKRRFHLLVLIKSGQVRSRTEAASRLAVHRHTVRDWLSLYEEGGPEGMRELGTPGPEPEQTSIPPDAMAALEERLDSPEGFAGYTKIQHWLGEEFGLDLPYSTVLTRRFLLDGSYSTVHGIVRYRLKAKPKVPRRSHAKKSPKK